MSSLSPSSSSVNRPQAAAATAPSSITITVTTTDTTTDATNTNTDTPSSITANILQCPDEIIDAICQQLCEHCDGDRDDAWARRGLVSLAQSCRRLNKIASPFVYHTVAADRLGAFSLVTTLHRYPELAESVRCVKPVAITSGWSNLVPDSQQMADFTTLVARCHRSEHDGGDLAHLANLEFKDWKARLEEMFPDSTLDMIATGLVLAATHSVETLSLQLENHRIPFLRPNSLHRLQTVEITYPQVKGGSSLDAVDPILAAAPSVDKISARNILNAHELTRYDHLRHLEFHFSAIDISSFEIIAQAFPNLQSFRFHSGGLAPASETQPTPKEIWESLGPLRYSLRSLHLDFRDDLSPEVDAELGGDGDVIASFRETQLEELTVDFSVFFREWVVGSLITDGRILVDVLPATIRSFELLDANPSLWLDTLGLATQAQLNFPHLRKVKFSGLAEDREQAAAEAFQAVGVECSFGPHEKQRRGSFYPVQS